MMNRVVRAVFAAVLVVGCGSAWADIPASAYVQDGLIGLYDAVENAGAGTHDGAAAVWVNLAPAGVEGRLGNATMPEGLFTINERSVVFNKGRALVTDVACAYSADPITLECSVKINNKPESSSNGMPFLNIVNRALLGYDARASYGLTFALPSSANWGKQFYNYFWVGKFTYSADGKALVRHTAAVVAALADKSAYPVDSTTPMYYDGVAQKSGQTAWNSAKATASPDGTVYIGNTTAIYEINSARFYSRELSAEDLAWNAKVDKARFEGDPSGYICDVEKRSIKTRVRLQAKYGTEMSFDGETWDTSLEDWVELDSPVTVRLRVPEGKVFSWGSLPMGAELSDDKKTLTFTAGVPVEVVAQVGETITWNDHADNVTRYWDDATKWTCSDGTHRVPCAYDKVVIPNRTSYPYNGYTIIATNPFPPFTSFYLGYRRTLTLKNGWDNKIEAETVTIFGETGNNRAATLTCGGGFTESQMSNRVWIVADELKLENAGSVISSSGYGSCNGGAWHDVTGMAESDSGSYGGRGTASHGHTYGSITEPTAPGSGSWRTSSYKQNGGGAVRIQAKRVVHNGSINATGTGGSFGWGGGGGSGGSIYISCDTIEGTGSVNANGGGNTSSSSSGAGGGGRVAVYYDTEKQKAVDCQVAFAARGGCDLTSSGARYTVGSSGTLYFSDDQFLKRPGRKLAGWVYYGQDVSLANSLVGENLALTNSLVELTTGAVVNVSGNLSFVGTNARVNGLRVNGQNTPITVGGDLELEGARLYVADGSTVSIGGDLTQVGGSSIHDSGEIYVKAAPTNGVDEVYGATLDVGGLWRLGANTIYYPVCNPTNGSIVAATAGSFEMVATAAISGNSLGWAKGYIRNRTDYFKKPVQPGTGTGSVTGYGLPGGGVVRIDVRGNMVLDGTISANGEAAYSWHYGKLPSPGGSVYLSCDGRLSGTGTVKANGGNAVESADKGANAGRIAIYYRMLADDADITAVSNGGSYRNETERSSKWGG